MTEIEVEQRLSAIEHRLDSEFGSDPTVLHPHGNRTKSSRSEDLKQENMNRLFFLVDKLDDRLTMAERWMKGLRGENGIIVMKNVISQDLNTADTSSNTTTTQYVAAEVLINGQVFTVNLTTDGLAPVLIP